LNVRVDNATAHASVTLHRDETLGRLPGLYGATGLRQRLLTLAVVGLLFALGMEATARLLVSVAGPGGGPLNSHSLAFDRKWDLAAHPNRSAMAQRPTLVLLGDSQMDFAGYSELLQARLAERGMRRQVINLGVVGNSPAMSLALLQRAIRAGYPVREVVLNVSLRTLNPAFLASRQVPQTAFDQSYLGRCLVRPPATWQAKLGCGVDKLFYTARYRGWFSDIWAQLPKRLTTPQAFTAYGDNQHAITEISQGGWSPQYESLTAQQFAQQNAPTVQQLANPKIKALYANAHASRDPIGPMLQFCQAHHLRLWLVQLPEHPYRQTTQQYFGVPSTLVNQTLAPLATQPNVRLLDLSRAQSGPDAYQYFFNTNHNNVTGAIDITTKLASYFTSAF
jgi:hypothetical protein